MSNVISIMSQKGGVGKSTVTTLLANIFYFQYKFRVAVVDADFPQNSIGKKRATETALIKDNTRFKNIYERLYADRKPYEIQATNLANCCEKIEALKQDYDYIFVDITGSINQKGIGEFLAAINHFYLPVLQDDFSIMSALELYAIIVNRVRPASRNFRDCKLFFNRVPAQNIVKSLTKDLSEQVEFVDDYLSAYAIYERVYRSTLFPIPEKEESASLKVYQFAASILDSIKMANKRVAAISGLKSEMI